MCGGALACNGFSWKSPVNIYSIIEVPLLSRGAVRTREGFFLRRAKGFSVRAGTYSDLCPPQAFSKGGSLGGVPGKLFPQKNILGLRCSFAYVIS